MVRKGLRGRGWPRATSDILYDDGQGVAQDYTKARERFEKAFDGGMPRHSIWVLYENGRGVPQDYAKAREWFEKAAAAGDVDATEALVDLKWRPDRNAIDEARRSGRYADALGLQEGLARSIEADEIKSAGKPGPLTAVELGV